jgi:hypothetical protein
MVHLPSAAKHDERWFCQGLETWLRRDADAKDHLHAAAPDATWASTAATFAAYFAADVGLLFFFFWVINLWVLDSLVIFGASATTIPFGALLSGTYTW